MEESIIRFLSNNYLKEVVFVEKLVGYVDCNFRVKAIGKTDDKSDSSYFGNNSSAEETFVLKVVSVEKMEQLDLEFQMMQHISDNNISTCRPIHTINGSYAVPWPDSGKVGYLLSYVPGITMLEAGNPTSLMVDIGRLVGKMDVALMTFQPSVCTDTSSPWEMARALEIEPLLHVHCHADDVPVGEDILKAFRIQVMPRIDAFQKGFIHGDVNNCNIIVQPLDKDGEHDYVISGIIDYGDACSSFFVSELVIIMADLMSSCLGKHEPLEIAKRVLKGYLEEMKLTTMELKSLKVLICTRLLQIYLLSGEMLRNQTEENPYVALERNENIEVCKYLWSVDDSVFHKQVVDASEN